MTEIRTTPISSIVIHSEPPDKQFSVLPELISESMAETSRKVLPEYILSMDGICQEEWNRRLRSQLREHLCLPKRRRNILTAPGYQRKPT